MEALSLLLRAQFNRHPAMQAQDVYKYLHQAALGSGHALEDEQAARRYLGRELGSMGAGPQEPMLEPISPDGGMLRVHLRAWVAAGLDAEPLFRAFLRTAREWRGSVATLRRYGALAAGLLESGDSGLGAVEMRPFFVTMEGQSFPAVHHSAAYTRLYLPAYRVVRREFLELP